jgi:dTDP-4-amino-4,6-dideoxygalactose transaminase
MGKPSLSARREGSPWAPALDAFDPALLRPLVAAPASALASTQHAPLYVSRPALPPLADLLPALERIWDSRFLTNGGPYHEAFEAALARRLGLPGVSLFTNCTLALMSALQALDLRGEVITTPYSFVATAHAIRWNGLEPVFADVEPDGFNIDPAQVEAAITPRTSAIVAVHCYGHACDVAALRAIADRHGLKLVYDAAHAFGALHRGETLLRHGDLAVVSFHATKVLNTFEGGAVVCHDPALKRRLDALRNFGFTDETHVEAVGLNAKMSEFSAALGLLQLERVDAALAARAALDARYRAAFDGVRGLRLPPAAHAGVERRNHAYFPLRVEPGHALGRDALHAHLAAHGVVARRYFHPLITDFAPYAGLPSADPARLPNARAAAAAVLCLPLYPELEPHEQDRVIDLVLGAR